MSEQELAERIRLRIQKRCDEHGLEAESLIRYVMEGAYMGDFMTALVENNLVGAACHADHHNQTKLFQWACVLYNDVPMDAKGSKEKVTAWMKHDGLKGLMREPEPDPVIA